MTVACDLTVQVVPAFKTYPWIIIIFLSDDYSVLSTINVATK